MGKAKVFETEEERILLRGILRTPGIVKIKDTTILDGSQFWDHLWGKINDGDIDKVVDCFNVALQFNLCLVSALAHEEESISHIGVVVPTSRIFPKQTAHIKSELRDYANRVVGKAHKKQCLDHSRGIKTASVPISMHAEMRAVATAPPKRKKLKLMSVNDPPVTPQVQVESEIALPQTQPTKSKGVNSICSECGTKKKHLEGCLFDWWRNQSEKPELGPKYPQRSRGCSQLSQLRELFTQHYEAIKARYDQATS